MKSIGFKLTAIMVSIILLGIAITVSISAIISSNAITRETLGKVQKSTYLEAEKLDSWLLDKVASINTLASIVAADEEVTNILAAEQSSASPRLEDQVRDILRPVFKALLDDHDTYFEVYMGFLDGSALTGSGYNFDYSWWTSYKRGWYELALTDTSRAKVTAPYVDAQTGELCITVARAVISKGKMIGVVGADIYVTDLQDITLNATLDSQGFAMLIGENGDIFVHPDQEYGPDASGNFKNLSTVKNGAYNKLWEKASTADDTYRYPDSNGTDQYYTASAISATGWYMITALPATVVMQTMKSVILIIVPITVAILLLAALLIYLNIRNIIAKPLAPLTSFMRVASSTGEITFTSDYEELVKKHMKNEKNNDEIGDLIRVAAAFVGRITEVSHAMVSVADGDLTSELSLLSEKDAMGLAVQKMLNNLNDMFAKINTFTVKISSGANQVADTAESIATSATQMAGGAQSLAEGAEKQTASVQDVSGSMHEISKKTRINAEMTEQAAKLADTIIDKLEKGSRQMEEMIAAVNDITEASRSVSNIIATINGIAAQTNLLALNAAIEAARAGEHGKGFAVVAEEVRKLAAQSAEAVNETSSIIQNSMQKAELGTRVASEMGTRLKEIVTSINESNQLITEITKATEDQSASISQIDISIGQVTDIAQQNSALAEESAALAQESSAAAEESAAAAQEMNSQTQTLGELTSQFKLYVPKRKRDGAE